jgi:hypothetical protein
MDLEWVEGWIPNIDDDGDYGHMLYCSKCGEKSYKCNCQKENKS